MLKQTKIKSKQLLLIHGWGMNKAIWHHLEQELKNKIELYSLDLPGCGQSDVILENYSLDELADYFAKYMQQHLDPAKQTIVLGWSLGGLIALKLAVFFSTSEQIKIDQLILVASTPKFVQSEDWKDAVEKKIFINFANDLKKDIQKTIKRFIAIQAMGSPTAKEDIKVILQLILAQGLADYRTLSKGLDILLQTDLRENLKKIEIPTSLIAGEHDKLVPKQALETLCEHNKNINLNIIKGAGHAPFISHFNPFISALISSLTHNVTDRSKL